MWSASNERRKYRKVIVERRRRERIDRCLEQLRVLVQPATRQSPHLNPDSSSSSSTKLEKADILELTVEYLRTMSNETMAASRATEGYAACLREVDIFLRSAERPTTCSIGTPGPSTPTSDRIRWLRTELIARLSSRAPNVVEHQRQHHLRSIPEVTSSPLSSSSPPTNRRVLADRNYRPVASQVEHISTTPTHVDCIPLDIVQPSTSLLVQSLKTASGTSTPLVRAFASTNDRHRRPKPYPSLRYNKPSADDSMAMPLGDFDVVDENCFPLRLHQFDVGNQSEMHPNERKFVVGSDDQSSMWRPW